MRFKCEKAVLLRAINSVINGIAVKKNTILEGILIKVNSNNVVFNTYNEEIGIEYTINAQIEETGAIVVQAHTFAEIIRRLPDLDISIYMDEETRLLAVECEGSKYKLATMKAEEFPELPTVNPERTIKIAHKELKNMIKQTIFAAGTDEKRKIYTGCLFDITDESKLNILALDGYRLALRSTNVISSEPFKMIVPGKTLLEITKILTDSFDELVIGYSNNQAIFDMGECKVITKLLEGEFVNHKDIIQNDLETKVKVNKNAMLDSIERVMLISNHEKEKRGAVTVSVEIGKITLSCINGVGFAKEEIFVETEGRELTLQFQPKFFVDIFKNIQDEEVYIEFGSVNTPSVLKPIDGGEQFFYIVLPIRGRE